MITKTKKGHYVFPRLESFENIIHGISSVSFGDMNIKKKVNELNIKRYADSVGFDFERMIFMDQQHTIVVKEVKKEKQYVYKKTDSLITSGKATINTTTADCVPIIFFDPATRTIATAHSGWKGTYNNISGKVLDKFITKKIDLSKVIVALGPSIRVCCYNIDKKRFDMFGKKYPKSIEKFLKEEKYKFYIDLPELIKLQLIDCGIKTENIEDAGICTRHTEDFFSFRKQNNFGSTKVFLTSIGLV